MPTGYTAAIKDGATFEEFAWGCARAPIQQRFEPSTYSRESLDLSRAELAALNNMTVDEAQRRSEAERAEKIASAERYLREKNDLRAKYDAMLAKVRAWEPPTAEHIEYKRFMEKQIIDSIEFDCDSTWTEKELAKAHAYVADGEAWMAAQRQSLIDRVGRDAKSWEEEVARTESRNAWISALRDSLEAVAAK